MKWLIITGASRGIGLATAEAFLAAGWQVISLARTFCPLPHVHSLTIDLSSLEWPQSVIDELLAKVHSAERLCLIHNAALLSQDRIENLSAPLLQKVLQVNVTAPAHLNQLLIPAMPPGSSILYVGSTLSEKAVAGRASYVISKHALVGMMRATCQDLADKHIHTACICPGFTDTEMLRTHVTSTQYAMLAARVGENRLIQPAEIAAVLLFAANQSVLNGSVIHTHLGQKEQ